MKPSTEVLALTSDEVLRFLENVGLLHEYQAGQLSCASCGQDLRAAGIGAGAVKDGRHVFVCSCLDCFESLQP